MSVLVVGSTNLDLSVCVPCFPAKGETRIGSGISCQYGGKGANQACAIGKLGGDVTFLSSVGDDRYGHKIMAYLTQIGVKTDRVKYCKEYSTGIAIINVDANGDNSIVVVQGANEACDVNYIRANEECFKTCDYVLLQMEIPIEAIEETIRLAAEYKKKIILNPAPANECLDKSLYHLITYMTPNEGELRIMSGSEKGVDENAKRLMEMGVEKVLVTLGEKGAKLYTNPFQAISVPACKVDVVDTVAAGDCFNGAFVSALDHGYNEGEAMKFANYVSAIAVTRRGAQESIPTREELETAKLRETLCMEL